PPPPPSTTPSPYTTLFRSTNRIATRAATVATDTGSRRLSVRASPPHSQAAMTSPTHLIHKNPRRLGATRRTGYPCPAESDSPPTDRKSTRLNSSHDQISYA